MPDDKQADDTFPRARHSASAEASLQAEIRRVEKMSIEERMSAALSLGKLFPETRKNLKKRSNPRQ